MISRDNASLIAIAATLAFPSVSALAAGQAATNQDLPPQQVPAQDPEDIDVVAGSSTMISMPSRIERVVVSDPAIADARPVSAQEVVLLGRSPGMADIVFRLENGQTVTRHLQVGLDEDQLSDRRYSQASFAFDTDPTPEQLVERVQVLIGQIKSLNPRSRITNIILAQPAPRASGPTCRRPRVNDARAPAPAGRRGETPPGRRSRPAARACRSPRA